MPAPAAPGGILLALPAAPGRRRGPTAVPTEPIPESGPVCWTLKFFSDSGSGTPTPYNRYNTHPVGRDTFLYPICAQNVSGETWSCSELDSPSVSNGRAISPPNSRPPRTSAGAGGGLPSLLRTSAPPNTRVGFPSRRNGHSRTLSPRESGEQRAPAGPRPCATAGLRRRKRPGFSGRDRNPPWRTDGRTCPRPLRGAFERRPSDSLLDSENFFRIRGHPTPYNRYNTHPVGRDTLPYAICAQNVSGVSRGTRSRLARRPLRGTSVPPRASWSARHHRFTMP